MNILFSLCYAPTFEIEEGDYRGHHIEVSLRQSDWGKTGMKKRAHHVMDAVRVMREARRYSVVVLCTVGLEAFFIGKWKKYICPKTTFVCADLLIPKESAFAVRVAKWLNGIEHFACIRQ